MPFTLPALPYAFDALEPHIDAKTMEIHHGKHHAAYVTNLNKALESAPAEANHPAEELIKHRLVLQIADQTASKEMFDSFFPGFSQRDLLVMKTNVSSANYWAVANGAGIGVFPTYAHALGGLTPLEIELRRPFDIWLSYHPGSGRIPRVRRMIDWLVEAFNPAKFPWFKDEFVHPREFDAVYTGESLTHLFGGFSTEGR